MVTCIDRCALLRRSTTRAYIGSVLPFTSVRDLDLYIDSNVTLLSSVTASRIVLRCTLSLTEREWSVQIPPAAARLTDTEQCSGCQCGGLLLPSVGRCFLANIRPTSSIHNIGHSWTSGM